MLIAEGLLVIGLAFPAWAQPMPMALPQNHWDEAALNRLFDGSLPSPVLNVVPTSARSGPNFIIKPEQLPLPPAPRYSLNLDAIPPELRHTIEGFQNLFHKNQEETKAWVDRTNALIQERNKMNGTSISDWTYDPRPDKPPFSCLSESAGTVNDWWALQLGRSLPTYQSANNGAVEVGLDPRILELEYTRRAETGKPDFFLVPRLIEKDPVRPFPAPQQPLGYAHLLTETKPYDVQDPYTGKDYRWTPDMSAMEGQYLQLFDNHPLSSNTPDRFAKVLAEGIEKWGIAYIQLELTKHPRLSGAHTVAAVGYFCMAPGQKLLPCSENKSAADWGQRTYFIIHDSFGNFPPDKPWDAEGGPAYRAVRIESIDKAIVFPHSLSVTAQPHGPGIWELSVANKGGLPVALQDLKIRRPDGAPVPAVAVGKGRFLISGENEDTLVLEIAARHYAAPDGKARVFRLKLSNSPQAARERKR